MALAVRVAGLELRTASGSVAVHIDHIGSTLVPGLAAKPIIDERVPHRSNRAASSGGPTGVLAITAAPAAVAVLVAVWVYDITKGRVREVGLPR